MEQPQIMIETSLLAKISDLFILIFISELSKNCHYHWYYNFYVLKFRLFQWLKKFDSSVLTI